MENPLVKPVHLVLKIFVNPFQEPNIFLLNSGSIASSNFSVQVSIKAAPPNPPKIAPIVVPTTGTIEPIAAPASAPPTPPAPTAKFFT